MYSWVFVIIMGALCTCSKVSAAGDSYDGELGMEANITLDVQTILTSLNTSQGLIVTNLNGANNTVTFLKEEVAAECLIIGSDSSCNCSTGYTWSNDVCYTYSCCNDSTCTANVSYITPLCIPKVKVQIDGSVTFYSTWDSHNTDLIGNSLRSLNGLQALTVTKSTTQSAAILANVSVKIVTSKLQDLINNLQISLNATIMVNILGMVTILSPNTSVCYESSTVLKCTLEQKTDSAGWTLNQNGLNPGIVVQLNNSCAPTESSSCTALTLQKVTGAWAGTYKCTFTTGSVTHTATTQLDVSLLPDVITMETSPLTADCSQLPKNIPLTVSTTILPSSGNYVVWWNCSSGISTCELNSPANNKCNAIISCPQNSVPLFVNVTFKNTKGQTKTAQVSIPVISAQSRFCQSEDIWPKTPIGYTVFNLTCATGRSGNKSRYCDNTGWQPVFDNCVNEELNKALNDANNFLMGLGGTQEKATTIFETIRNTSNTGSNTSIADISASINVLNVMAQASENIVLTDSIFPTFVNAASNMVNQTWKAVNTSILYSMSSSYLQSVENLVANIKVNGSQGVDSTNMNLTFCSGAECHMTVFDIAVNINMTNGTLKVFAVKNLVDKLNNNYKNTDATALLSATLQDNNDSSLKIELDFPNEGRSLNKAVCVFWNTTDMDWSDLGCTVNISDENHTVCVCNHLTSFSVLISKDEVSPFNTILEIITNVGLAVSIFSLMIFLTIECLVWSAVVKTNLAHFRHTAMVNIATFLLLADISFLASTRPGILPDIWCLILTMCKHLFYLAMFCWMLCLSIMLVHQLIFVFSPLSKRVFIVFSSIVGYILPLLIVGSSYAYSIYMGKPYYNKETCWLIFNNGLDSSIHAFLLPVGTIILTNIFSMMVIIFTLVKSWVPSTNKADDKMTAKSMLKVVVVLTPIFGITWIIGFFQLLYPEIDPLKFFFTILNSFQGIFILLTGCFTEQKIREELYKMLTAKSNGTYDSTKNLISATDTRVK
ncbi:adhesion G-protein coupled receptor F1-like [Betta splendens]|uniref:Adhesion G-protein coupled receptor F1-like n=1 Tax=Betta splendens TaxID=158456 RepID=A0A6P7LSQ9_BETSP|nr:adhesion G-protein coupled receptor F1-like [Betta splendens]XP_055362480.1 adhesion G-protein coupled receptor F1-like [Betta splendens]